MSSLAGPSSLASLTFDWDIVHRYFPTLLRGLWLTIQLALWGFALAAALAMPVALARRSRSPLLRAPATVWVNLTRGVPLFVVLFWIYNGLALRGVVTLSEFWSGAWALGLTGSGYMAEVYRGSIDSVDPGQHEAGLAVGLGPRQVFGSVVLPQALRTIVPSAGNVFVGLLKGASLVSVIGLADMFYTAKTVAVTNFAPFELYTVAGVMLIVVTIAVSGLVALAERRLGRSVS